MFVNYTQTYLKLVPSSTSHKVSVDISWHCSQFQVNNIARPIEYEDAVKSKEAARENIQVAETERPRQLTQANTVLREAETQAVIDINRAETDGRISRNA